MSFHAKIKRLRRRLFRHPLFVDTLDQEEEGDCVNDTLDVNVNRPLSVYTDTILLKSSSSLHPSSSYSSSWSSSSSSSSSSSAAAAAAAAIAAADKDDDDDD